MNTKKVIEKISKIAEEEKQRSRKVNTIISMVSDDIYYQNTDFIFYDLSKLPVKPHAACAIDGSMYKVDIDDTTLIITRAVKIRGFYGEKKEIPPDILEDLKLVSDYYGIDKVNKDAIISMLTLETNMLKSCEDCDIIFIDGPIIDPPTYDENDCDLKKFVDYRVNTIKHMQKNILGIAKRFSQRFIINYFINNGYSQLRDARENSVVKAIFRNLREKYKDYDKPRFLGWIDWGKLLNPLDDLKGVLNAYKIYANHDIKIFSGYYQYNAISPISRIDILNSQDLNLLSYVKAWSYPLIEEITILNRLADEISGIKKDEAETYAKLLMIAKNRI
ncbi:nuclease [Acidianus sulfidivorans JP7]|uniref:Nuclease n=1 Tax=Acidianus sulfidivorans JP7 TaxID=619593 RepID=A0A2U9IK97_9CREN|nr:DNA double-strand break repair nuclease NurA [Acidianus sulfidivorans]AWR96472.1 nuclease [Acidianus sulfidivorans JP7]